MCRCLSENWLVWFFSMRLTHGRVLQCPRITDWTKEGQGGSAIRVLGQSRRQASCVDFVTIIGYSTLKKQLKP